MKKIVILGGGENQLPLIKKAKELEYYVVLCDFRNENPGKYIADVHYLVNTLNYEEVYEVCLKEKPDGITTNSEPAIPVMTKIAQAFNLPGNNYEGVVKLMSKSGFRSLQEENNVFCPKHYETDNLEDCKKFAQMLKPPFIIKPCESSATRGTVRFDSFDGERIARVFLDCKEYSYNKRVCLEEFVEMPSMIVVDGDVFVYGDNILWNGMFSSTRHKRAPMVPTTQTYPINLDNEKMILIKESLHRIFKATGVRLGEFNIEGYFTIEGKFFIIEINVRQGGNNIPQMIYQHCGIDYSKLLVSLSVGDESYWSEINNMTPTCNYICHHPIYSFETGTFEGISYSDEINNYIKYEEIFKKKGDLVERCKNATHKLGYVTLEFENRESQLRYFDCIDDYIKIQLS